jgi:hyaluronate lyase
MDSPVNTTVEHRRIVEPELHSQKICLSNGTVQTMDKGGYYYRYTNPKWFLMEGHAGYVFLEDAKLLLNRYKCETADSQSFLRANIEHGKNPVDASYAYAIIPYATEERLNSYHANADVEIISNTTALQAVREKNLCITGYVFHEAGSCEGIEISEAAILVVKEKDGKLSMRITDPTHELKSATIVINKPLSLIDAHKKLFVGEFKDKTVITVDFKGSCGRPYGASFEIK